MKIKTQFRINILVSICLAAAVTGILFYADRRIDREMEKNFLADRISKGVFELFMVSNNYLTYHEERPRTQWSLKLASLKKMIDDARLGARTRDENLEILSKRCDEMGTLFQRIISYAERIDRPSRKDASLIRDAYERHITNLTAKGQEMINHAFLLIQESNRDLASVKTRAIVSVVVATLLAIVVSIAISLLLGRRILTNTNLLQKGAEIVAGGNLDYRVDIQSDDEIGRLAQAFDEMTRRLNVSEREREDYVKKLAQSNRDLEDFAFIASHDLQEPLRKLQTFGDRIKAKWGDHLGEGGNDYLIRMQNAALRMQSLIEGLLNYSRVTTRPEPFTPVSLASVVHEAVADLLRPHRADRGPGRGGGASRRRIESHVQMRQLFQNLLGNSLKYAGKEKPLIKVFARRTNGPAEKGADRSESWVEIVVEG